MSAKESAEMRKACVEYEMKALAEWSKENPMPKLPVAVDQAELIRELVGALERLKDSYRMSASPLSRMDAWHEVDSTLAKVPEEYRG